MGLHLKQTNAIGELLRDRLLLILAHGGACQGSHSIAVVRSDVGNVRIEAAAQRGVSVADARTLYKCLDGSIQNGMRNSADQAADNYKCRYETEKLNELEHDEEQKTPASFDDDEGRENLRKSEPVTGDDNPKGMWR